MRLWQGAGRQAGGRARTRPASWTLGAADRLGDDFCRCSDLVRSDEESVRWDAMRLGSGAQANQTARLQPNAARRRSGLGESGERQQDSRTCQDSAAASSRGGG
jgi:hypothetical protein